MYTSLARLVERVRHWRATEVLEPDGLVSAYQAREMAWCASSQLTSFRDCRVRLHFGISPRCALCPLFDAERAIRDVLGENPPPSTVFEITLGPNLRALLTGELSSELDGQVEVPDYPPEEWEDRPAPGQPPPPLARQPAPSSAGTLNGTMFSFVSPFVGNATVMSVGACAAACSR